MIVDPQTMDSVMEQYFEQLLAENAPTEGPLCEVIQNLMDVLIKKEEQRCSRKPLQPQAYQPVPPHDKASKQLS